MIEFTNTLPDLFIISFFACSAPLTFETFIKIENQVYQTKDLKGKVNECSKALLN